jgi:hypothetical protein
MRNNPDKTVSANSRGIIISFRDVNKHKYIAYESKTVSDIQLYGKVKYQQVETPAFNKIQQQIYSEALYGLSIYDEKQIALMAPAKKKAVTIIYNRVQRYLNSWKQELVNIQVDKFMMTLFPHSPITKQLAAVKGHDESLKCKNSFKELGITKAMIAKKLYQARLLPENFYQLA